MSAFVEGGPMLKSVEALLSPAERAEIATARPYQQKIDYIGVDSEAGDQTTTTKLIVGLRK